MSPPLIRRRFATLPPRRRVRPCLGLLEDRTLLAARPLLFDAAGHVEMTGDLATQAEFSVTIDGPSRLNVRVDTGGAIARLILRAADGSALVESDGAAAQIAQHLDGATEGTTFTLDVSGAGAAFGGYRLTADLAAASAPFQPQSTGPAPGQPVAADFNGDGIPDLGLLTYDPLATFSDHTFVSVAMGIGDGTFGPLRNYSILGSAQWLVTGDFNGDGRIDLAADSVIYTGDFSAVLEVFASVRLGIGDGTFGPEVATPLGKDTGFGTFVAAEIDGDGHQDLVFGGNVSDPFWLVAGNGDGTFQPKRDIRPPLPDDGMSSDGSVQTIWGMADFNSDGRQDFVFSTEKFLSKVSRQLVLWINTGGGSFRADVPRLASGSPVPPSWADSSVSSLVPEDVNGDGADDILLLAGTDGTITLFGDGLGSFSAPVFGRLRDKPLNIQLSVFTADGNGDGRLDLVFLSYAASNSILLSLGDGDGNFASPTRTLVERGRLGGVGIPSLVVADLNRDGLADIAVPSASPDAINVLLAVRPGVFKLSSTPLVGPNAAGGVRADFNGDDITDVAVISSLGVSVILGIGDGGFRPPVTIPGPTSSAFGDDPQSSFLPPFNSGLVTADFNRDGREDLAYIATLWQHGGLLNVALGRGDGTFRPAGSYAVPFLYSILAVDLNGDGILDIAAAGDEAVPSTQYPPLLESDEGTVTTLLGRGDGTFLAPVSSPVTRSPAAVAAADFNGDGILDLVVSGDGLTDNSAYYPNYPELTHTVPQDSLDLLLGRGDGTFLPPQAIGSGFVGGPIAVADFNGDGRADLAVMNDLAGQSGLYTGSSYLNATVLLNSGEGRFRNSATIRLANPDELAAIPAQLSSVAAFALDAGDFDGDGRPDLATLILAAPSYSSGAAGRWRVSIRPGNGDGTFRAGIDTPAGEGQVDVGVGQLFVRGDYNGDGTPDLTVIRQDTGSVAAQLGRGDGRFFPSGLRAEPLRSNPLRADLDRDGTADLAVLDGAGEVLFRRGRAGLPGLYDPPIILNPDPADAARDLAVIATPMGPALALLGSRDGILALYAREADGVFHRNEFARVPGGLPVALAAADLDGDGLDDVIALDAASAAVSIFFQRASGFLNVAPDLEFPVGGQPSSLQIADIDGDGRLDLVVAERDTGQVAIFANAPGASFAPARHFRAGDGPFGLTTADGHAAVSSELRTVGIVAAPSGQGGVDLIALNAGGRSLASLRGDGGGNFLNPVRPTPFDPGDTADVIRTGDFDGDGRPDLAVLDPTNRRVSVLLGSDGGSFGVPVVIDAGAAPSGITLADADGDGKLDLLIGNRFGDILTVLGNGDGSFRPFLRAGRKVALAAADLNHDGRTALIFADQGADRVSVQYGASTSVVADRSSGLLAPGAVTSADLNGDGLADLIVANSGANAVMVYPGLGDGQFGPAVGGGFGVGTDPVAVAVADVDGDGLPDLAVANHGSNDVSILLGQGRGASWTLTAGTRLKAGAGPTAVAVQTFAGPYPDLVVSDGQSNDVRLLTGLGGGFFDDRQPKVISVGQAPNSVIVGNFGGRPGIVTVNSGSNDLTLVSHFLDASPTMLTIPSGGLRPVAVLSGDFLGNGGTGLVVANNGDGRLSVFLDGPGGLSLSTILSAPGVPSPTALALLEADAGSLSFYVAGAGGEAATLLSLELRGEASPMDLGAAAAIGLSEAALAVLGLPGTSLSAQLGSVVASQSLAQLRPLDEAGLALVATLLTVLGPTDRTADGPASDGADSVSVSPGGLPTQATGATEDLGPAPSDGEAAEPEDSIDAPALSESAWSGFVEGLSDAMEQALRNAMERLQHEPSRVPGEAPEIDDGSRPQPPAAEARSADLWDRALGRIDPSSEDLTDSFSPEQVTASTGFATIIAGLMAASLPLADILRNPKRPRRAFLLSAPRGPSGRSSKR